jgi:hypothetical protein
MAGGQRMMRLIGDGGGGIPLSEAFGAVAEYILDHDSARYGELVKLLMSRLALKEERILSSAWRTWEDFTTDILDQMSNVDDDARPILMNINGQYLLGAGFIPGQWYSMFRDLDIGFKVHTKEERERRDRNARHLMIVRGVLAEHDRLRKVIEDTDDNSVLKDLQLSTGFLQAAVRTLSGGKVEPEKERRPHRVRQHGDGGTVKTLRGSKISNVPTGPLPWARDWLRAHPGEWMTASKLRDLYAEAYSITEEVSAGSVANGLNKLAPTDSPVQRKETLAGPRRVRVEYAWIDREQREETIATYARL